MTTRHTEVVCLYYCIKCKKHFVKVWREIPWFQDYHKRCKCGHSSWPVVKNDYSYDKMNASERRWDRR